MNDLFTRSFKKYANLKDEYTNDPESGQSQFEMVDLNTESQLNGFFTQVEDVKSDMEVVEALLKKLQESHEESKTAHSSRLMKQLRDRMDKDVEMVLRKTRVIKTRLEALDTDNSESRRLPGCGPGTPTDRTRMAVVNGLRKKLKTLMSDFQLLRKRIMEEYRETVGRRYFTVTGEQADDETIETIIATGESEDFLQKAIQEQGRGRILDTIQEIRERHDAVREIEKNLLDLHQIFLDMAVLVEAQGEQLNDIEHHITNASSFVQRGAQQLVSAKQHQRSSRKWMCIGIILLLVIVAVIVIPVAASLRKS